jgi:MFS family permease
VYIFALNSLTVSLLAIPIVNWLISPHKTIRMIYVSITLLVVSLVLFGIAKNIFVVLFAMFLFSIAEILFFPSLDTTLSEQCPPGFTGRSFGLLDMGGALGGALGNLAGGFFYPMLSKQHGSYYWIVLAFVILIFSNTIMLLLVRHTRQVIK